MVSWLQVGRIWLPPALQEPHYRASLNIIPIIIKKILHKQKFAKKYKVCL